MLSAPDGEALGSIPVGKSNDWKRWPGRVPIPDGVQSIYLRFKGSGCASLYEFELSKGL